MKGGNLKMINYLLSGVEPSKGFTKIQENHLKKDITQNQKIVFIASTFKNPDKNTLYYNTSLNWFKKININFSKTTLIDNKISKKEAQKLLKEANIVFLMGGDTTAQMNSIKEYNLEDEIKNKKIVIGVSAGSLNQSKTVIFKDDYQEGKIEKYQGLGLTNINIYPHFNLKDKEYTKEVLEVSNHIPLIALPNDSFIRIENNNIEFVGTYYLIENNKIITKQK